MIFDKIDEYGTATEASGARANFGKLGSKRLSAERGHPEDTFGFL